MAQCTAFSREGAWRRAWEGGRRTSRRRHTAGAADGAAAGAAMQQRPLPALTTSSLLCRDVDVDYDVGMEAAGRYGTRANRALATRAGATRAQVRCCCSRGPGCHLAVSDDARDVQNTCKSNVCCNMLEQSCRSNQRVRDRLPPCIARSVLPRRPFNIHRCPPPCLTCCVPSTQDPRKKQAIGRADSYAAPGMAGGAMMRGAQRVPAGSVPGPVIWSKSEDDLLLAITHEFGVNWTMVGGKRGCGNDAGRGGRLLRASGLGTAANHPTPPWLTAVPCPSLPIPTGLRGAQPEPQHAGHLPPAPPLQAALPADHGEAGPQGVTSLHSSGMLRAVLAALSAHHGETMPRASCSQLVHSGGVICTALIRGCVDSPTRCAMLQRPATALASAPRRPPPRPQTPMLQAQAAAQVPAQQEAPAVDYTEEKALMALYMAMTKQQVGGQVGAVRGAARV